MLEVIADHLQTYEHFPQIFIDYLPDQPDECAGLFCWEHASPAMSDGSSTRYVQVRVRSRDWSDAMITCTRILTLLDSGPDETPLPLDFPGAVIGRPRRWPVLMERTPDTVTVYAEIALWGETNQH